jgi:hypothetical protein
MTNTQLYLAIGIPMLVFIGSMIVSLVQISGIREDMRQLRNEFGQLRSEVRADIQILTGKVIELMKERP